MMPMFKDLIPQPSLNLVKYRGSQVIDKLGKNIISNVVLSILSGDNLRSLTEGLTQRRLLIMNSGLLVTFLRALSSYDNFTDNMVNIVYGEIESSAKTKQRKNKLSADEKQYLLWFLGLTLKGVENVARGRNGIAEYVSELDQNLTDIATDVESMYGDIKAEVKFEGKNYSIKWPSLVKCMLALGAQTLTIRGSEKSIYGKLFEKFVLGSALTIMGGEYINKEDTSKDRMVFWLSEREDRRESDATLLLRPGIGISFDIGFIGRGNPEIAMDKLTRFENKMERGQRRNYMSTIILIDTIGESSRAKRMAYETGGYLIQMSGTYWVKKLAENIHEADPTFDNPLLHMTDAESLDYLKQKMQEIDLSQFLTPVVLDDLQ